MPDPGSLAALKPIIYGILKNSSMIDFEGHLAKVLFTAGCNFRCGFCHNNEMIHAREGNITWAQVDDVLARARDQWVDAVCISGGEPTMHRELLPLVLYLKGRGFKVKLDTNGAYPERLEEVKDVVDFISMDYKTCLARYHELAGVRVDTAAIRASIRLLAGLEADRYEFRTTVMEGIHNDEVMRLIATELSGAARYVLQPFVPQDSLYDPVFTALPRTSVIFLERLQLIARAGVPNTLIRGVGI